MAIFTIENWFNYENIDLIKKSLAFHEKLEKIKRRNYSSNKNDIKNNKFKSKFIRLNDILLTVLELNKFIRKQKDILISQINSKNYLKERFFYLNVLLC